MVGDDNPTAPSRLFLIDAVLDAETSGLHGIVEDSSVFVVSNSTEEYNAVGWKNVLGSASGILGSTSSNQLGGVVVEEIFVDGKVLFLGENGIIGLEAVFVEEGLITLGLDIWGQNLVSVSRIECGNG